MTLLWIWLDLNSLSYFNTALAGDGGCQIMQFHFQIMEGKMEYVVSKLTGCKSVKFKNKHPYFTAKDSGTEVMAVALHCSGGYKNYMPYFAQEKSTELRLLVCRIVSKLKKKM